MSHHAPEVHCEMLFSNVRMPADHLLGEAQAGFALAQARLGPGRVHHRMRSIGQCELALEMLCERALTRRAFCEHLSDFANVQDWIAESRVEIDQSRLDVSAIKLVAARLQTRVRDRAIQVFGAMGLTLDTPLANLWT